MRDVTMKKVCRGFGLLPTMAAVIYSACRLEGLPRTQKEICTAFNADVRSANRIYIKISKSLGINNAVLRILPKHLVPRLCSQLRLNSVVSEAVAVCDAVAGLGLLDGNSPSTAAAAAIYFVCKRKSNEMVLDQIYNICDKNALKLSYEKLLPHAEELETLVRGAPGALSVGPDQDRATASSSL